MWMIRAQATNRQKNSRRSNKTHWKNLGQIYQTVQQNLFLYEISEQQEIYGVFSILVHLWNIQSLGICEFWSF